jgi:chromosome segregation ATPase
MRTFLLTALLLVGAAAVSDPIPADKNRPVTKVINLLKDMLVTLEKEAKEDEEVYDTMACWCETGEREKTKAIAEAEKRIEMLKSKIEELTALSAQLAAEIKQTEEEVAENQAALDKATSIREKQLAEFNGEEKDLMESISALKAALEVLGKHNAAFLQTSKPGRVPMQKVATALQNAMTKHSADLQGVLTHSQRRIVSSFIQAPQDYFDAEPTFKQSYAPQSGEIYGILSQMKDTFESNLAASQKEEAANQASYDEVRAAKDAEIQAGQAQIDKKTQEKADTDEKNANAKVDLEDTEASKAADEEYLAMLKAKCSATDAEWDERQKERVTEMEAVSKAIAILSSDDAFDLNTRTFNAALLQASKKITSQRRQQASTLLLNVAEKVHSPRLAAIASSVKLDAFTKVKKAIDDMVAALLQEKADEIKQKDFCVDEFNTNQLQTEKKEREKADLEAKIADLEQIIKDLTAEIETLTQEISDLKVQMKRAGEDREKENKDFQAIVADQRATMNLLKAALEVLSGYYGKVPPPPEEPTMLQQPVGPPPPPGFDSYKKSGGSIGVMELIEQIIADAKKMEAEAIRAEEDAQTAYESYVKETNESINAKTASILNKSEEKAVAEKDLAETKTAHEGVMLDLENLSNYNAELHASCDFVMKNFEVRQTARDQEVQALRQAKAILSGAKFEEFLQG